jgi:hypothetical protein
MDKEEEINKYYIAKYTNKKGEHKTYKYEKNNYNIKLYNITSYNNRKDRVLNTFYKCELCDCDVVHHNRFVHFRSNKHILKGYIENQNKINNLKNDILENIN